MGLNRQAVAGANLPMSRVGGTGEIESVKRRRVKEGGRRVAYQPTFLRTRSAGASRYHAVALCRRLAGLILREELLGLGYEGSRGIEFEGSLQSCPSVPKLLQAQICAT